MLPHQPHPKEGMYMQLLVPKMSLTLQYVCTILNHVSTASLGGQVPLQVLYGVTPDICIILLYTFYQPVFYATHDQHFPSDSDEMSSFWVGLAEHCGDSLTHMVLDAMTLKIIYGSALRPKTPKDPNKRLVDAGGGGRASASRKTQ